MKAYKVVRADGARYLSAFAVRDLQVEYQLGKWTRAPIGGILCFEYLHQARIFTSVVIMPEIFEVIGIDPVPLPAVRSRTANNMYDARSIWIQRHDPLYRADTWPEGTLAFEAVKPVRAVYNGEGDKGDL